MVMIIVGLVVAVAIIVAYTFAFRVEERVVEKLTDLADKQLNLPIQAEVVSQVNSRIRFIRKEGKFSIYYLRENLALTEVYSATMIQNAPTGNTYKSHLIKMSIDTRSLAHPKLLLNALDEQVKSFQWNYFETKLDGNVYLIKNEDSIDVIINVPMYSQSTWEKMKELIVAIYNKSKQ